MTTANRIGKALRKLFAPRTNRLIADLDTPMEQQLLHIFIAQRKRKLEPNCIADDLSGEAVTVVHEPAVRQVIETISDHAATSHSSKLDNPELTDVTLI